jgi:hypothetical protein
MVHEHTMDLPDTAQPPARRRWRAGVLLLGVPLAVAMSGSAIRVWAADPPSALPQRRAGHASVPCEIGDGVGLALISLGASH